MNAQNVVGEDWDYLLVLDACRFDFFERVYEEYLGGTLEKRRSLGSSTPEWAAKTFTGRHDITYFSSNPFINSLGVSLHETKWGSSCDYRWAATDHLSEVIDVWDLAWDEQLGTVPPENVNEVFRERRDAGSDRRTILHYMQPHAPYISGGKGRKLGTIRQGFEDDATRDDAPSQDDDSGLTGRLGSAVRPHVERVLSESELAMKLGMLVDLNPTSLLGVGRHGSRAVIEGYYEENLRLALDAVADVAGELDGTVVITADHGEAFGEDGVWEHHIETHIPVLVEVPWLVLD